MDQLNETQIHQHVTILGWLHIVGGALFALIGLFVLFLLLSVGAVSGDMEAARIMAVVGIFVGGLMLVLALPGILAGIGLLRRQNWGRILALIVGLLNLLNFPLGTALGIYTFWVLLQQDATTYFH